MAVYRKHDHSGYRRVGLAHRKLVEEFHLARSIMSILSKIPGRTCCLIFILMVSTAQAASTTGLARQVLEETNIARTQPRRYAGYLQELRRMYRGKMYRLPGTTSMVMTSEVVAALDEAVAYLSKQSPMPPLAWSEGLAEAAGELVRDQGETGDVGHDGSRSGDIRDRIERHGKWTSRIAENIGYGPTTARLMVMELIIDDGVPDRGHRKNIFTRSLSVAGAACGPHPTYRTMCVMDFAGGFKSRGNR